MALNPGGDCPGFPAPFLRLFLQQFRFDRLAAVELRFRQSDRAGLCPSAVSMFLNLGLQFAFDMVFQRFQNARARAVAGIGKDDQPDGQAIVATSGQAEERRRGKALVSAPILKAFAWQAERRAGRLVLLLYELLVNRTDPIERKPGVLPWRFDLLGSYPSLKGRRARRVAGPGQAALFPKLPRHLYATLNAVDAGYLYIRKGTEALAGFGPRPAELGQQP